MPVATFPCTSCGAELEFKPGTTSLTCRACGALNEIPAAAEPVEELDFKAMLAELGDKVDMQERVNVHCDSCGAHVELNPNTTSQACPFCGSNIVATGQSRKVIKPRGLIPFKLDRPEAMDRFRVWLRSLWFAPTALKKYAFVEGDAQYTHGSGLAGIYLPFWTFDCAASTTYSGERGDDYYVSVPRTVVVNGRTQTQMVQERRTRWSSVRGTVQNVFDDILVAASTSLPVDRLREIGKWEPKKLVPYQDGYLAGYRAETYTIDLPAGFEAANAQMRPVIESTICSDIGGDHQRIASMSPSYRDITFKHILLPIWVSAYRYNGKVFRFLMNGVTGEISGERPYSAWKITLAVLGGLVVVGILLMVFARN